MNFVGNAAAVFFAKNGVAKSVGIKRAACEEFDHGGKVVTPPFFSSVILLPIVDQIGESTCDVIREWIVGLGEECGFIASAVVFQQLPVIEMNFMWFF